MKLKFRGWTSVYSFTFRQATRGIGFRLVSVLIALVIIGAIAGVTIFNAKPDKEEVKETEASPIQTVYVLDNSGLAPTDYKALNPELSTEQFNQVSFQSVSEKTREEVIDTAEASSQDIAVVITTTDTGFALEAVIPSGSTITQGQASALLAQMSAAFETSKLLQSGLTQEQLTAVLIPAVTSYADIGENTNIFVYLIKTLVPMIFALMFYVMLALYGQTVSKSVSTEKTSKLMETLLTSVHPYALISGKILAVTSMALLQFILWIASIFAGLYGGDAIAHAIYPEYKSSVLTVISFLKDNFGASALSAPALILAILFFCIGFLFYCVIAGLGGCMVSKPEDVAATQQIFMMPVVISFLVAYLAPMSENEVLIKVIRYIPFTSPLCVPSDLLIGTISLGEGVLALAALAVFTFLIILLSGRIYKGLILYSGQKLSLKTIGNVLKSNSN
jgi:ABC-type Na+ efflux pump permease subunit